MFQPHIRSIRCNTLVDLQCQLSCRRENQSLDAFGASGIAHQLLNNGNRERRRFTGTGLRSSEDVVLCQSCRDGLFLYGGWLCIALG